MDRIAWMPFFGHDFFSSRRVMKMTAAERGAYISLLWFCWTDPICSLPNDQDELKLLAAWNGRTHGQWAKVMACFTAHPEQPNRYSNPRLYREWLRTKGILIKRQAAGKARWHQPLYPTPSSSNRTTKSLEPIRTEIQTITDKVFPPIP